MKFEYPSDDINDENAHNSLGSTNQFGFFPVSLNNSWHGGVHIEGWWEKIFAIADGEIIAYKLPKEYCEEVIGKDKYQYSNGFVLIRHNYKSPKEQELTFFSLYMHLLPKKSLMAGGAIVPSVFTNRGTVVEGLSANKADGKTRSEAFVIPEGETVTMDTYPGNEVNDPDHWVKKAKAESKFQKIKFLDKNNHLWKEIYIATAGKYVEDLKNGQFKVITKEDKGHAPENYSFNIKELDKVVNCHIPVKAGNLIGYTAKNGFGKQPNYRASHVEVFTAQDPTNFLNDANDDGKDEKNYFKVKAGAILKKAYPGKIPGNGQLKVKNGEGFSQVHLISLTRTILRIDLEPMNEKIDGVTHYKIKTGTHFNNVFAAFDKKVNQSSILVYVSESVENGVQKRKVKYQIVPEAKKYWIANGEVPDGTDELRDFTDELTTIYEHKPVANHLQETVSEEIIVAKKGVRNVKGPDNQQWYYLEIGNKSGWIKEGSDCEAISAYNWKEFGFNIIEDKEDLFIYDPKSPPKFMKDIWAHMDTEVKDGKKDGNLSAWELRNAYSKPVLAQKLSKMVCKHTSEWAWIDQWGTFKPKVKELYKDGIKLEQDSTKREVLETKRDQAVEALEIRLKSLCFWKEVKTAKPLGQDPEQFTSSYAVATGFWGNNYVALPPEKPKTLPTGIKDFPTNNPKVYHFHPVAFVQQMRRIFKKPFIDWDFISKQEGGCKLKGYVPHNKVNGEKIAIGRSGVTIAIGFDIGQHNQFDLKRIFSQDQELIDLYTPYLGKKKSAAIDFLENHPLEITAGQAEQTVKLIHQSQEKGVLERYKLCHSFEDFKNLPTGVQTSVMSISFQYGPSSEFLDAMWNAVGTHNYAELYNFFDSISNEGMDYYRRRKEERDFLKDHLNK